MKTVQHTPGPWKRVRRIGGGYTIQARNFYPAVALGDGRENKGVAIANARLIAAAPELLEALRGCAASLRMARIYHKASPPWCQRDDEALAAADAAIEKAEGRKARRQKP